MGSLRNPIGPLPSSIYWRRRAVALTLLTLLAMLVAWAVSFGDGGSRTGDDGKPGAGPAPSITPGDEPSGPAISERPGGRDEADGGASSGNTGGAGSDGGGGTGGTGAADGGTEGGDGTGKNGDGDPSTSGGVSAGRQVPANSPLPNCAPNALKLTLRSSKVSYTLGEKPRFELIAQNTSAVTCKADFGPKTAVLTVVDDADDSVWSTKDCPQGSAGVLLRVPANSTVAHFVDWDRRRSAPAKCATPPAGQAQPGTYLVEATFPGAKIVPASFRLEKD
ncbi:hypothetical protein [Streptomyces sp. NPDC127084]|uniref:hypothetical protein n=1 Tax=Streptomyces sp. NPDC127084 TaxID=3347133 RepID=UPI00364C71CB